MEIVTTIVELDEEAISYFAQSVNKTPSDYIAEQFKSTISRIVSDYKMRKGEELTQVYLTAPAEEKFILDSIVSKSKRA